MNNKFSLHLVKIEIFDNRWNDLTN